MGAFARLCFFFFPFSFLTSIPSSGRFQEGECFTVLATRTHKQFVWKGRHKNVTGLFSADRVVEIDEGGTAVAPTPVVGAWSAAFELAVSQSVSSMGVAGDESSPFSSPRRTRTPSPRRGHSLPGAGDAVRTDPLPTISRSQSQTLRSDGSSISSSATDHHKVRRRRRGVTESPGAGSVRVRSDASSRPHSHNMETEVLMLSPRDDDMYLSPRAAASEPGGLVSGSMSGDDESEGAHGKPSASHSGVFAGQTTPTSLRLLVVVRNANGSPVQANIDGSGTNKLTVTSTRSGPPRHFKVLAPLLADNMPSTYVVEVERIAGTVVDVAIDDVPVSGSPVKL
jgi:hypothetical protein